MFSLQQLKRHFDARRFDRMLDGAVSLGSEISLPLRVRLSEHSVTVPALSLGRITELLHAPTPLSRTILDAILTAQEEDETFGGDPLAAAAVAAAISRMARQWGPSAAAEVADNKRRALEALAAMQEVHGQGEQPGTPLFVCSSDHGLEDRAATAAFVLFLLAGDPDFHRAIRAAELINWFEDHAGNLDEGTRTLWRLARCDIGAPRAMGHATTRSRAA